MKRFLKHSVLFSIPVLGYLVTVWWHPVAQEQQWNRITGNCSKSACIYHLTEQNQAPIDVAFIGTSRTMNAVNDTLLSQVWGLNVINLGYCRPGRNVHFEIVRMLLEKHKPKALFVEVNQEEDWYGHFDYGNVASTHDVLWSVNSRNPKYFRDVKRNFIMKYDLFQNTVRNESYASENCTQGFGNILQPGQALNPVTYTDTNNASQVYASFYYLENLISLAQKSGCKIYFHYLPALGLVNYDPHHLAYYQSYGPVIFPPSDLEKKELWADNSHIIPEGAMIYSTYLAQNISPELFK